MDGLLDKSFIVICNPAQNIPGAFVLMKQRWDSSQLVSLSLDTYCVRT